MIKALVLILVVYLQVCSPSKVLKPGKNVLLQSNNHHLPITEPHLAVNPNDPNHLVTAAMIWDSSSTSDSRTHIGVFVSKDNGQTWKQTDLEMETGFDPWLAFTDDSIVVLTALVKKSGFRGTQLGYYVSKDGGFTWATEPIQFGSGHDHQTLARDKNNRLHLLSVQRKNMYYTYTDNWLSPEPKAKQLIPIAKDMNTLTILTLNDGTIILPYIEYSVKDNKPYAPIISIRRIKDSVVSEPFLVTDKNGIAKGFPVFASGKTKENTERLYFLGNKGMHRDTSYGLYLKYSDDMGSTWSEDIVIAATGVTGAYLRTGSIAVSQKGVVAVCWYERNDSARKMNDVFISISRDAGKTFATKMKITETASNPYTITNGKAGERHAGGGDYIGFVAKPGGNFQIIWADSRTGVFQLFTSEIIVP